MRSSPAAARADGRARPVVTLAAVRDAIVACDDCSRLRRYCARIAQEKKAAHRNDTYWGRPVPGFGDAAARLLLVGLAPAAHGANRTGRVFTGDGSGDFLAAGCTPPGSPTSPTSRSADDGLTLRDAYILAAVALRAARQQADARRDRALPPPPDRRDRRPAPRARRGRAGQDRPRRLPGLPGRGARHPRRARAPRSRTPPRRGWARGCRCCWTATTPAARTRTPRS